ncbi:hypothetical protein [Sulfurovum sp.]|uniref:hypothetical protein n=1 Tax=Sulfurovum sp. TaxID=1969726 RepID=UPI003561932B
MRRYLNKKNVKISAVLSAILIGGMAYMTGCGSGGGGGGTTDPTLSKCSTPIEASLSDGQVRIGGATTSVELLNVADTNWTLYNTANELHITSVDTPLSETGVEVEGYIHDIEIVNYNTTTYALLAMGQEGITAVEISDTGVLTPRPELTVKVNYNEDNITWTEGSGTIVPGNSISSSRAPISSLAVYNEGNTTNPSWQLIIGDEGYGLHKTALENFFTHTLDTIDSTLKIDDEVYTLQYAGESPWGGPKSLTLVGEGNDTKIFVAQGFMGMGIYDTDLDQVGRYNHYIDTSVTEDWFRTLDVSSDGTSIDSCTGMPDYTQASLEINGATKTPWANFETLGKYYYDARNIDVATIGGRTIAYIAYGMAGMVAVNVTGYETATARSADCTTKYNFLDATYLGYVPAIPAHGPDDRLIGGSDSVFSRQGAGMLKDAGVADVKVDTASDKVFYTDHFGGLMVVNDATNPDSTWHGPDAPYDNDINDTVEHLPSYEFVTSYDMNVSSTVDEALPDYTSELPILLTTGEVGGHGNSLALTGSSFDETDAVPADIIMAAGAGGLNFIEVYGTVPTYDFNVTKHFATTDEIGAAPVGYDAPEISVGHAAGVGTYDNLLYLADGPHGMMVWKVADESCNNIPTDQVRLVGNTLQSENSIDVNGTVMYPTPHADEVVVINDGVTKSAMVASLSAGLRRVNVNVMGTEGAPELLYPTSGDIYEHSIEETKVAGIDLEDRVYDVAVRGDLAFTADGLSGVTVYNLNETPNIDNNPVFIVDNIKGTGEDRINNATGIALWGDYAFVAGGATGITVIDISDPSNLSIVKTFQPIKWEDANAHNADGVAISVKVVGNYAFFTYDSFGVLAYNTADLINPVPHPGTEMGRDGRYDAAGYLKLQDASTYTNDLVAGTDFSEWGGGASGIDAVTVGGKTYIYVAYGDAGAIKIDWTDAANPVLVDHANTAGSATDIVVWNGRVYVADGAGGFVLFQ